MAVRTRTQLAVKLGSGSASTRRMRSSPRASSLPRNTGAMTLVPILGHAHHHGWMLLYMRAATPARVSMSRTTRYGALLDG